MVFITHHAEKRASERFGWTWSHLYDQANKSVSDGLLIIDDPFLMELFKYTLEYRPNAILYMYKGAIFVFCDDRLVTIFPIDGRYSKI